MTPRGWRRLSGAMAAAVVVAWGCSFTDDLKTPAGATPCPAQREAFVEARAQACGATLPDGRPVTLAELLALVEDGAVEVQEVRAQVDTAAAEVAQARSALLPNLLVGATGLGYARRPGSEGFVTDRDVADAAIELSVPLDVSGRLAESVRAAQARYRSAAQRLRAKGREQRLLVARGYFLLLDALDLAEVNRAAIAVQERALKDGQARYEAGVLRKSDVLVIEVALSNARQRSVALATAVENSRRALNSAAGLPIRRMTEVAPFDGVIPVAADVVPLLDRARRDNPEVDVLVETRNALLHELRANVRSNAPDVSIGPRLTGTTEHAIDPGANFLGFVSVSWNPDVNGRITAERRGIQARMLEVAWSVTGLLRSLEERILKAHRETVEKTSALVAAETSVGQAHENLRIVLEQFRAGTSTGREVLEAQALMSQQDGTLRTARHAINASQFELWYLAGSDPIDYVRDSAIAIAETRASAPESR
jgi:outer membrane protein